MIVLRLQKINEQNLERFDIGFAIKSVRIKKLIIKSLSFNVKVLSDVCWGLYGQWRTTIDHA